MTNLTSYSLDRRRKVKKERKNIETSTPGFGATLVLKKEGETFLYGLVLSSPDVEDLGVLLSTDDLSAIASVGLRKDFLKLGVLHFEFETKKRIDSEQFLCFPDWNQINFIAHTRFATPTMENLKGDFPVFCQWRAGKFVYE